MKVKRCNLEQTAACCLFIFPIEITWYKIFTLSTKPKQNTNAQKGEVTSSDYTVRSWPSLEAEPAQWCFYHIILRAKALWKKMCRNPPPPILEFSKGSHVDAGFSIFLSSAFHSWVEFSQRFQSYSYHLFLARGISELALSSEQLFEQNLVLPPPSYPGKKKAKGRNKGISCAFKMTFLADGD